MARGATLAQLISDLRDELRRANSPSASPDDTASLRRTINHVYATLYYNHDWAFLKQEFPAIQLQAGEQYYDMPDGLDIERIISSRVKWSGDFIDIVRGISLEDYNAYDPEDNERNSPALKWDVRFTGTKEQIQVWPLPDSSSQSLRFVGVTKVNRLVNDTDICRLDSDLVVLYAAAELLKQQKSEDADAKLQMAQELLRLLRLRSTSGGESTGTYRVGLGPALPPDRANPRTTVYISGGGGS